MERAAVAGSMPSLTARRWSRVASPLTATLNEPTAAPASVAACVVRTRAGAIGRSRRCQPAALHTSESRFTPAAAPSSPQSAEVSVSPRCPSREIGRRIECRLPAPGRRAPTAPSVSPERQPAKGTELVARRPAIGDDPGQGIGRLAAIAFGIVAVAVMEEQDGARPQAALHALADNLDAGPVGIPDAEGPAEDAIAVGDDGATQIRVAIAVRGAEAGRGEPGWRARSPRARRVPPTRSWAGPARGSRLCVWVWLPSSKPERATSRARSGYRSTCRPTMKNVAGTCSRRTAGRSARWCAGWGPGQGEIQRAISRPATQHGSEHGTVGRERPVREDGRASRRRSEQGPQHQRTTRW